MQKRIPLPPVVVLRARRFSPLQCRRPTGARARPCSSWTAPAFYSRRTSNLSAKSFFMNVFMNGTLRECVKTDCVLALCIAVARRCIEVRTPAQYLVRFLGFLTKRAFFLVCFLDHCFCYTVCESWKHQSLTLPVSQSPQPQHTLTPRRFAIPVFIVQRVASPPWCPDTCIVDTPGRGSDTQLQ